MIFELEKHEMYKIAVLFADWEETILWSCLQGDMGNAFVTE